MLIANLSCKETSELLPLIQFVSGHCDNSAMANLIIEDSVGLFSSGRAWKFVPRKGGDHPILGRYDFGTPSLVRVGLSTKRHYPKISLHRQSVGPIEVSSWEEEFVFVLAHELRHIAQFWSPNSYPTYYEVDAESHGKNVLELFRGRNTSWLPETDVVEPVVKPRVAARRKAKSV